MYCWSLEESHSALCVVAREVASARETAPGLGGGPPHIMAVYKQHSTQVCLANFQSGESNVAFLHYSDMSFKDPQAPPVVWESKPERARSILRHSLGNARPFKVVPFLRR